VSNTEPLDLVRLRREIDAEVRARRASGAYPPGFERELDAVFARYAPAAATDDIEAVTDQAEEAAGLELAIPTASERPGGVIVKRLLAKLFGWYHAFLVQQIVNFAGSIVAAVRVLGRHVEALETATGNTARAHDETSRLPVAAPGAEWNDGVVDALRAVEGRVLVAECGTGDLLAALGAAGIDAYGVEPRIAPADAAAARGLEVRADDLVNHLRAVGADELAAMALVGVVDRAAPGELLELVDLVTGCLRPGAVLAVVSRGPTAPVRGPEAVTADLAPGRPVHPETWSYLLDSHGFETIAVRERTAPFEPVPGDGAAAKVMNENFARLFGSGTYLLVARSTRTAGSVPRARG
jgi:SAM-dependent methyltransferase